MRLNLRAGSMLAMRIKTPAWEGRRPFQVAFEKLDVTTITEPPVATLILSKG
jgi:hypothetical protein